MSNVFSHFFRKTNRKGLLDNAMNFTGDRGQISPLTLANVSELINYYSHLWFFDDFRGIEVN